MPFNQPGDLLWGWCNNEQWKWDLIKEQTPLSNSHAFSDPSDWGSLSVAMCKLETILVSFYTWEGTVQFQFSTDSKRSDFEVYQQQ